MNSPASPQRSGFDLDLDPEPEPNTSAFRVRSQMVFMSGVTPRINLTDDGTSRAPLVPGTFDEQCVDAFSNLTLMLIKTGITKSDVVDVTVYLTNIATNTAAFRHRWDGFFSGVNTPPCRSIIGINALEGGYALQMRVVAMLPDQLI